METKNFNLITIEDVIIDIQDNPGITEPQINYSTSIGGSDAPTEGATKNTGALADLDAVNTDQIVAGAITKVKMALLSVDADIIAAGAITESKLYTGAVTADKIAANTITAAKIAANTITASQIAANTITATEMNVSQLSAISANIGTITSGTITGATLQTSSDPYTGVKISSSIGGMDVYDENLEFYVGSTKYGIIGGNSGGAGYFNISSVSGRNIKIDPTGGSVFIDLDTGDGIAPLTSGYGYCGLPSQYWANVYTNNLTLSSTYGAYINFTSSRLRMNSDTQIIGTLYASGAIECSTARIRVGSYDFYPTTGAYDASKYYLRT